MAIRLLSLFGFLFLGYVPVLAAEPAVFFPIMAWDNPTNDPAFLKKVADCGFNVAGFAPPAALDNCQAAGLEVIVSDPCVSGQIWPDIGPKIARQRGA